MEESDQRGLFGRLTRLFRNGPVVTKKIKQVNSSTSSSAFELFRKTQSQVYSNAMSAYGTYDRLARYADFSEMEYTPELSSALDIYSEEVSSTDENGNVLHIFSNNSRIEEILTDLFIDTLNIEFNLTSWVRNLCKYGDFFLFNDVHPERGIINTFPIPVSEIEREEGFDKDNPMGVRFRWITQGNQVLENWQVSHFRLLGNDAFLPYGSSVLEAARRIWRQLILVEDAMLVYRVVRSPERRVFYVDVGNVPPEDIPNYMEQVQSSLKKSQIIDKSSGRVDLRYNPLSVDEDYFLPVRGGESGTRIDTLAGGTNATAIEDVEYIQKKLFSALKIPKAYLGYDEGMGSKATLSQEDIRFSRTIQRIQRTVISELNKLAIIHLYCHGFSGEDLVDFSLSLSNPSTIAQQQKLELFRTRFEIISQAPDGYISRDWLRKNILNFTDDEIEDIDAGRIKDRLKDLELESVQLPAEELSPADSGEAQDSADLGGLDLGGGSGGLPEPPPGGGGEPDAPPPPPLDLGGGGVDTSPENASYRRPTRGGILRTKSILGIEDDKFPVRVNNNISRILKEVSDDLDSEETEKEKKKRLSKEKTEKRRKSKMTGQPTNKDLAQGYKNDPDNSIRRPNGRRKQLMGTEPDQTGKNLHKLNEDDFFLKWEDDIQETAKLDDQIKSTLKSMISVINRDKATKEE